MSFSKKANFLFSGDFHSSDLLASYLPVYKIIQHRIHLYTLGSGLSDGQIQHNLFNNRGF
jgi:hypothetical protein